MIRPAWLPLLALLLVGALVAVGCDDDDDDDIGSTASPTMTATATETTPTETATAEPTTDPTATVEGDDDGTSGGEAQAENCADATFEDLTGQDQVTIEFEDASIRYQPACIVVAAGSTVTFSGNFAIHPLAPGAIVDGERLPPAEGSPLEQTTSGTEATFVLDSPGTYPFYCEVHAALGMQGSITVQ